MDNIVVITQNVKLDSLSLLRDYLKGTQTVVFSSHLVFENEKEIIIKQFGTECVFANFSSLLTDADFEYCDVISYLGGLQTVSQYYSQIKKKKNLLAITRLLEKYPCENRFLVCDDLGIDAEPWLANGFIRIECDYYHDNRPVPYSKNKTNHFKALFDLCKRFYIGEIHITRYDGKKCLFFGSLNRIGYRLNLSFVNASKSENIRFILQYFCYRLTKKVPFNKTIRMSTLHESTSWPFPHHPNFNLKIIQDGYLPPNYSCKYLLFHGPYVEFYTWDIEGRRIFRFHGLKSSVIPFRKKLYLPIPRFPQKVKKVLCVASGAGDWTALKSRSDEDLMMVTFGKVASLFPNIEFIYRCHPVWVHPQHQGVNSIKRAVRYFQWLNLPNLRISSNIPEAEEDGKFLLSYKRSSFEEDLDGVDVVFGEHSIAMIDAAFKGIILCSINVTGRRDLFQGITEMGFPHCESVEEICSFFNNLNCLEFRNGYKEAVDIYNGMTDRDL